jgi:hypothetical protein
VSLPTLARTRPAPATVTDDTWVLYTGATVELTIPGISPTDDDGYPLPVLAVFDLLTLTSDATIPALSEHDRRLIAGRWQPTITPDGVTGTLTLIEPADAVEAEILAHVVALRAAIRTAVPVQCSVGVEPGPGGSWEQVTPGQAVTVNGRSLMADPTAPPLWVLRGGRLFEASLVTFGADDQTGRAAAHKTTPRTAPMSQIAADRLKALAAKFPAHLAKVVALAADGKTDDEINQAVCADQMADALARAQAAEDKLAGMVATPGEACPCCGQIVPKADELAASEAAKAAHAQAARAVPHRAAGPAATAGKSGEPKTTTEAIKALMAEDPKLKASAARLLADKRWPNLERR